MCKGGFSDGAHTECLEDSIVPDSEESYLSNLAQKAADAAPDGTTLDKFLMFFAWGMALVVIGAVIVQCVSMITGQPIPFVQWNFKGGGTAGGADAAGVSMQVISDQIVQLASPLLQYMLTGTVITISVWLMPMPCFNAQGSFGGSPPSKPMQREAPANESTPAPARKSLQETMDAMLAKEDNVLLEPRAIGEYRHHLSERVHFWIVRNFDSVSQVLWLMTVAHPRFVK
jgi:hypothetical protein